MLALPEEHQLRNLNYLDSPQELEHLEYPNFLAELSKVPSPPIAIIDLRF